MHLTGGGRGGVVWFLGVLLGSVWSFGCFFQAHVGREFSLALEAGAHTMGGISSRDKETLSRRGEKAARLREKVAGPLHLQTKTRALMTSLPVPGVLFYTS